MAELNFGLLTPPGSQSIGNAFVSGMDQAAAARQMENQNALSQYTLSKAKREDELTNQLLGDLRVATTPEEIYRAYQRVGKPDIALKMQNDALTRQKLGLEIAGMPGEQAYRKEQTAKLLREAEVEREKYAYEKLSQLALNPGGASDDDVRTAISDAVSSGNLSMVAATRAQTALLNTPIEKRSANLSLMAGNAGDRIKALMPDMQLVTKPDGSMGWVNKAPMSPGFGGDQGLPGYAAGMTPTQSATTGMRAAELRDQGISIPGFYAPGTPAVTGAPQNNAMLGVAPDNAMIRPLVAPGVQQTTVPATTRLSPKATRELALKQAEAQIPKYDATAGGFVYPPSPENPQGKFTPVTGMDGKPLNEVQAKSALFGSAMQQANTVITEIGKKGTFTSAIVPGLLEGIVKLAPLGIGDAAANAIESTFRTDPTGLIGPNENQQRLAQAQLGFAIAYLRSTSGAAFGAQEVANTIKEYFPLQGESKIVIDQKSASRERAIQGMRLAAGKSGSDFINKFTSTAQTRQLSSPSGGQQTGVTGQWGTAVEK